MNNTFTYFDKIYVISAKNNHERRTYVNDVLSKLDINFEFFDAIMGNDLTQQEIDAVYDEKEAIKHKTHKRPLSKPEIGCALSHIEIYKEILSEGLQNALIFEDDIDPNYEALKKLKPAINELPENWDVFYLGVLDYDRKPSLSFKLKLIFYYPFVKIFSPQSIDYKYFQLWNLYSRNYSKLLKKSGYHVGCQAYGISKKGAEKFLAYHDKIATPVDNMLSVMFVENELNGFLTKETMFYQNQKLPSAIEDSRRKIKYGD